MIHQPIGVDASEIATYQYEEDMLLMVGDWYHSPAEKVMGGYDHHDSWGREV